MAFAYNVGIVWDELVDAFSAQNNRIYFLDNHTGEIFFVPSTLEDEDFWRQMENHSDRFLRIPRYDYSVELQIVKNFIAAVEDTTLKALLNKTMNNGKTFGNINDILSFFPEEDARFMKIRDEFLSNRVKQWLEINDLFPAETITSNLSGI